MEAVVAFVLLNERIATVAFVPAGVAAAGDRDQRDAHGTEHDEAGDQRMPIRAD